VAPVRSEALASPLGPVIVVVDEDAIVEVAIGPATGAGGRHGSGVSTRRTPIGDEALTQLEEYFEGRRREFDLPVRLVGTPFRRAAWEALCTIPFGSTISYGEQAARMGRSGAARAVGGANGANPIPIVIPCHRVVGADGSLTGYTGGLHIKSWLLDHERRVAATT
jgi:methylated-DNA-[protein]-cysteine S-methyltransferase